MTKRNILIGISITFATFTIFSLPASADYTSLQTNGCTLLQESNSQFKVINSTTTCSSYIPVATTSSASIQVFGKCTNGDLINPRFDVFTYSGVRGSEIGGSKLYQTGVNYSRFSCDNVNRNVNGTISVQIGTNQSFFVAASNATSSASVIDLFERGIGNFANALIHFDIKSAFQEPPNPDPVIIIPGILGSSEKNGEWVIDPIFHTYDDLIATLEANGYQREKDLFTLPYDWKESNVLTALKLRDKINKIQAACQCDKVDLVAHSMGGLVARQYIQSDKYENDVDQLIFLGTPHLGAPKAYLMWEGGGSDFDFQDQALKFIFSRDAQKAGFSSLFDYVRNRPIPSVQELFPIYDYLRDKSTGNLRTYPNNYPQNTFLENLKTGTSNLLSKVKVTNIVGDVGATSTINTIRVVPSANFPLWEHGYPEGFDGSVADKGLERFTGDSTVPLKSSKFITNDLNKLNAYHYNLPIKAEGLIFKKLTNKNASVLVDNGFSLNLKLLLIKILSPVDVQIIAPDGKRIGKDFATGQEINEIEGAFYSGFLIDNEYVTIPNPIDGEYKIKTKGTDTGHYTVAVGYISDNLLVDKDFTAQTKPSLTEEIKLSLNNANPTEFEIKPTDTNSPLITATSPEAKDYLRSETLPISVSISDHETGVFSSEIKFDDRIVNDGDNPDLFFEKLGNHSLTVSASDFVGNLASTAINFRIVSTVDSTISDIERAYSLGWIDSEGIRKSLIKKLKEADKKEREKEDKNEKESDKHKPEEKKEKHNDENLYKEFLKELEAQRGKHINEQAYALLKEDVEWLMGN